MSRAVGLCSGISTHNLRVFNLYLYDFYILVIYYFVCIPYFIILKLPFYKICNTFGLLSNIQVVKFSEIVRKPDMVFSGLSGGPIHTSMVRSYIERCRISFNASEIDRRNVTEICDAWF